VCVVCGGGGGGGYTMGEAEGGCERRGRVREICQGSEGCCKLGVSNA
jgi:hypothetical protein